MTITGHIHPPLIDHARNPVGVLSAVLGGIGVAALVWAWLLTTSIDPLPWVRAPGLLLLPVGVLGSLSSGVVGLLSRPRFWAVVGLTLGVLTLAGLGVLEVRYG